MSYGHELVSESEQIVPQADPVDAVEQSHVVDLDAAIEDYPWVRRDAVVTIGGHRFLL
ncbi:hypothetical protein SAMN04489765_1619 [Tsukamurella pulmonis]|uniref:Uncharacterized protein n=1 Tax=Tsukamurella pulmonis TaxID=47312 RepID=A0A1H1D9V9_9ACTN|nr:hypothetical protein [Tsukamurella pulmonis]SDQ73233.1 hypothetical protein SAMN04489765_1619 [Tsukamurella pulmonis]SUP22300.1 Uncharacterised protein [Tsukamurella pulmonis]